MSREKRNGWLTPAGSVQSTFIKIINGIQFIVTMADKTDYNARQTSYDVLLKDMVPHLTKDNVGKAVDSINQLVELERPRDWAMKIPADPRVIVGITSDRELAVYGEGGNSFDLYKVKPLAELKGVVTKMVDKAKREYDSGKSPDLAKISVAGYRALAEKDLERAQKLLEDVVSLEINQ